MLPKDFIPNTVFNHSFEPLNILTKARRSNKKMYLLQGSLSSIIDKINDGILPDFDTNYEKVKVDTTIPQTDIEKVFEKVHKHQFQVGNVRIIDKSDLKDKITSYFTEHVKLDSVWKQILGDKIYIVLSAFYTDKVEFVERNLLKEAHHTQSSDDTNILLGFTGLEIQIKRDGSIGKIKMATI